MSQVAQHSFRCNGCGKSFVWKSELAGKKVRCKCGSVLQVPADVRPPEPAAAAPDAPEDMYDLAPEPATPAARTALTDDGYRCPSCGQGMVPGALACTACGFNLRTGQRGPLAASPTFAQPAPVLAYSGPKPKPPKREDNADQKAALMRLVIPGAGVVLLIVAVMGLKMMRSSSVAARAAMPSKDAELLEMIEDSGYEAKEWLEKDPNRMIGLMSTTNASMSRINMWYKMGATKVYAFGSRMSLTVVIELPDDPESRKKLFDWQIRWHEERNIEPEKDVGQRFLQISGM